MEDRFYWVAVGLVATFWPSPLTSLRGFRSLGLSAVRGAVGPRLDGFRRRLGV